MMARFVMYARHVAQKAPSLVFPERPMRHSISAAGNFSWSFRRSIVHQGDKRSRSSARRDRELAGHWDDLQPDGSVTTAADTNCPYISSIHPSCHMRDVIPCEFAPFASIATSGVTHEL